MDVFESGTAVDIFIPLKVDDEYVVPTPGTLTYTVRDHSGTPMVGFQNIPVVTDLTTDSVTISLTSGNTAIVGNIERRTAVVEFKDSDGSVRIIHSITLVAWINTTIIPEDIRVTLAVDTIELPDHDVDIPLAYFKVTSLVGKVILDGALQATSILCLEANNLIKLQASLDVLPALEMRAAQKITSGQNVFSRFKSLDFGQLRTDLMNEFTQLITLVSGRVETVPAILTIPTMVDPVTG